MCVCMSEQNFIFASMKHKKKNDVFFFVVLTMLDEPQFKRGPLKFLTVREFLNRNSEPQFKRGPLKFLNHVNFRNLSGGRLNF